MTDPPDDSEPPDDRTVPSAGRDEDTRPPIPRIVGDRFELGPEIGRGATSVVHQALDRQMGEGVKRAVKLIRTADHVPADARFDQTPPDHRFRHPALVGIIARGRWADGFWIAMEWVDGKLLAALLAWPVGGAIDDTRTHSPNTSEGAEAAPPAGPPPPGGPPDPPGSGPAEPWSGIPTLVLIRVLAELGRCVGVAHGQKLVHLDLKPDNVMVEWRRDLSPEPRAQAGLWFGDEPNHQRIMPRVLDWGLGDDIAADDARARTQDAAVYGAPWYMAPERIRGHLDGARPAADVFALGAMLYQVLTGSRPFGRGNRAEVFARRMRGEPPEPLERRADPRHAAFFTVCTRAMSPDPADRHADGLEFALDLQRARALLELEKADDLLRRSRVLEEQANALEAEAAALRRTLRGVTVAAHEPIWALEDTAADRRDESVRREAMWLQSLRRILTHEPELAAGRAAQIAWRCDELRRSEAREDARAAWLALESLRADLERFDEDIAAPLAPAVERSIGLSRTFAEGRARLTVVTSPACAVQLARETVVARRLEVGPFAPWSPDEILEHGRVVLKFSADGCPDVIYPVYLERGKHTVIRRPGEQGVTPVPLPPRSAYPPGTVYIAPGWCTIGGERFAMDAVTPGCRVWVDGVFIGIDPISHRQWAEFLDALVAEGRGDEAERRIPGGPTQSGERRPISLPSYERDGDRYRIVHPRAADDTSARYRDAEHWPVNGISREDALAYLRWRRQEDGIAWRLPSEWEMEKVARCGDSRRLPWGVELVPAWTRIAGGGDDLYMPAPLNAETFDITSHGVRWTVGNVLTWCREAWADPLPRAGGIVDVQRGCGVGEGPHKWMLRGGSFGTPAHLVSGATRFALDAWRRPAITGLRLAVSWPDPADPGPETS